MKLKKQLKVLVVEDNPGDARLLEEHIAEKVGDQIECSLEDKLSSALKKLETDSFDTILSDLSLPDSSGIETYRALKNANGGIPIIILSGNSDEELAMTAVREGAHDYLTKGEQDGSSIVRCILHAIERKVFMDEIDASRSQQQYTARLAAVGEMAGGVAHEVNTPLAAILLSIQGIRRMFSTNKVNEKDVLESLKKMEDTVERIAQIVRSLRTFARNEKQGKVTEVTVKNLIEGVYSLCREKFSLMGIRFEVNLDKCAEVKIQCRESEIGQVLLNLLNNARDAVECSDEKWIKINAKDLENQVEITVSDSGSGIPKEFREKVFIPFHTTKDVGKGTGLGLSISKGLIESHGGVLNLDETKTNTTFVIRLPKLQMNLFEERIKSA